MILKKLHIAVALTALFLTSTTAFSFESKIVDEFWEAQTRHSSKKYTVVRENEQKIPGEIDALMNEALSPETDRDDREALFNVIDRMANAYGNVTGEEEFVKDVRKRIFESRLGDEVPLDPEQAVHVVESHSGDGGSASFRPDNIIVKRGDTVKWVNTGVGPHLVKSILVDIGERGISSPLLKDGQSWGRRFYRPGVYYYMAISGKAMYGKITVVDKPRDPETYRSAGNMAVKAGE